LLVHTRSDGRKLTVESRHVLTRNAAGQPAGILEINRDITERVSAEQQLREVNAELEQRVAARTQELAAANRELEAFAYSVSHDLRAPLRGIEGWSVALLEDCAGGLDERGRVYLDRVRSETLRMGRLIEEMLRLSRVARLDMEFEPVDLSALAQDIAGRLRESCPERNVTFHIAPAVVAAGDRHLLEIALTNLFENAVKFTANRPHPEVEFGQVTRDGNPAVFVRDNGVGFDMAYAHRLFGPFQRLHKDSEFPGIGVGLATVQRVIHRHGGRIWAESAMGSGATFYFVLGTALASAAAPGGPAHVAAHGPHAAIDNGSGHVQYGGIRKI
jgi:light-regulated signal transduction histidine kinase (bacteriophytochrome)